MKTTEAVRTENLAKLHSWLHGSMLRGWEEIREWFKEQGFPKGHMELGQRPGARQGAYAKVKRILMVHPPLCQ